MISKEWERERKRNMNITLIKKNFKFLHIALFYLFDFTIWIKNKCAKVKGETLINWIRMMNSLFFFSVNILFLMVEEINMLYTTS